MIDVVYTVATIILGVFGTWAFISLYNVFIPRPKLMKKLNQDKENPDVFKAAGMEITQKQYNLIRYAVCLFYLLYASYQMYVIRSVPFVHAVVLLVIFVITSPEMPKLSIVPRILRFANKAKARKLNEEVLIAFIQLKNLALLDTQLSAYEILSKLLRQTKMLKPYLSEIMKSWNFPDKKEASFKAFVESIKTTEAENFLKVILKLDNSNPYDLLEELKLYEQQTLETRTTLRESRNNALSDLNFTMVTLLMMIVLLNFIMVQVFPLLKFSF